MEQERPDYLPKDAPMTAEEKAAAYRKILEKIKAADDEDRLRADNALLRAELEKAENKLEESKEFISDCINMIFDLTGETFDHPDDTYSANDLRYLLIRDRNERLAAAEAKLARVVEAARPFLEPMKALTPWEDMKTLPDSQVTMTVNFDAIMKLSAALAAIEGGEPSA